MKSIIVIFVLMILMIIFGVILMLYIDGWLFIEGIYFIFISVFMIGFGDYVVNDGELKFIDYGKMFVVNFIIVLIIFGLCVVFSVFCLVSVVIEERQRCICIELLELVINVLNVVNLVLNIVISNLFLRLLIKVKVKQGSDCSLEENKENGEVEMI